MEGCGLVRSIVSGGEAVVERVAKAQAPSDALILYQIVVLLSPGFAAGIRDYMVVGITNVRLRRQPNPFLMAARQ